ncbi:MAG TPA: L,D-transpeptidase family protein [Rhizomicrobium sp.]|nr:L,D-transpeptidase family protein [Rhizomicrobium sp.]
MTPTTREGLVKAQVQAFYAARDFRLVWSGDDEAEERAAVVRQALEHADRQGLRPGDYLSDPVRWADEPKPGRDAADYDVALTTAFFAYALDVREGRVDPLKVYKDVNLPVQDFDLADAFATALRRGSVARFLSDLPPPHPGYHWLVDALARYRDIAAHGAWPVLRSSTTVALTDKNGKPSAFAHRLALEDGAFADTIDPSDADLREALLRFQRRNGLEDNGRLTPDTLKALNVPVSYRIQQIIANMERWRWVPRAFEARYILVNVPDQSLEFVEDQSAKLSSKVVIGRRDAKTPIMRTEVVAVVANPAWDIPDDIAAKRILPHLRHHPDYLASRNMVLANGSLQQNPGNDNVLGKLMLDSPNPFGVYMHDTPDKKLFLSSMRERSNGCVRVEQIAPLASLALGGEDPDDRIIEAIATGETQRLELSEPLAVYMLYWTAFADSDGAMEFRPDRYDRDPPLIAKLGAHAEKPKPALAILDTP